MDLSPSRRLLATPVALVAWFALGLQLFLVVRAVPPGDALLPAVGRFFSYFTVLNNLLVALVATGVILSRSWRKPALEAATAVYIFMVGVLYSLLLRHIWAPTGWQKVADGLLHDVVPVLFVVWWLFDARTRLAWRNVALYLLWPLLYLAITLVDGALTGWYPLRLRRRSGPGLFKGAWHRGYADSLPRRGWIACHCLVALAVWKRQRRLIRHQAS